VAENQRISSLISSTNIWFKDYMPPAKISLVQIPQSVKAAAYVLLLLAALLPVLYLSLPAATAPDFELGQETALDNSRASMAMGYACSECLVPSVHGANVIETRDGGLFATWFGGSREGGRDVELWGADYVPATRSWSVPRRVIGPAESKAALGRYIKTVGNSVLVRGMHGELWLYYVTVSVGGWAGSSLNVTLSNDEGKSWNAPRRLITSPFFNVSTLNKSAAIHYRDGTIGLPVYHEFIGKFAELLHLDSDGRVLDKTRITQGRHAIQPLLLPLDARQALALMRDTGPGPGHVLASRSADAGRHWSPDQELNLPNPDSAVAGLRRPDGSLLLVFNDVEAGRSSLALAVSRDQGRSWQTVRHFEQVNDGKSEFSYPYMIRAGDGSMHLLYTWNRKRIRHVVFNDNWVEGVTP
jgi:predicted neuraminidase